MSLTVVITISTAGHGLQRWSKADGEDGADVHHPEADGLWENQGWSSPKKNTTHSLFFQCFWRFFYLKITLYKVQHVPWYWTIQLRLPAQQSLTITHLSGLLLNSSFHFALYLGPMNQLTSYSQTRACDVGEERCLNTKQQGAGQATKVILSDTRRDDHVILLVTHKRSIKWTWDFHFEVEKPHCVALKKKKKNQLWGWSQNEDVQPLFDVSRVPGSRFPWYQHPGGWRSAVSWPSPARSSASGGPSATGATICSSSMMSWLSPRRRGLLSWIMVSYAI